MIHRGFSGSGHAATHKTPRWAWPVAATHKTHRSTSSNLASLWAQNTLDAIEANRLIVHSLRERA